MITLIAGVNGAGKSSIIGSHIRHGGGEYFNPDEVTRLLLKDNPELSLEEANAQAWRKGYEALCEAIDYNYDHTFETTLGGNTIFAELMRAAKLGREIRVLFCGLASVELHIERVAERVARGGHDIPEAHIRRRYINALDNMRQLIPYCDEVRVFDNTLPLQEGRPRPRTLFHLKARQLKQAPAKDIPAWAKPLALEALRAASHGET